MAIQINNKLLQAELESIGWFPGRQIDVAPWLKILNDKGFQAFDKAVALLSELGGLEYEGDEDQGRCQVVFDPRSELRQSVTRWELSTGCKYFPLGVVDNHSTLWIGNDGSWNLSSIPFFRIGKTDEEGLLRLFLGIGKFEEFPFQT
ncbi:MAG: SUKH-3 domain-containing protein [Planctomycetaceae bacterium]